MDENYPRALFAGSRWQVSSDFAAVHTLGISNMGANHNACSSPVGD